MRLLPAFAVCAVLNAQSANTWFERGRAAFEEHDDSGDAMREAESDFRRALLLEARHAPSIAYLGLIAADRGQRKEAEALYQRALTVDSKCAEALVGLARIRVEGGAAQEARSLLREAVRGHPDNRLALRELAFTLTAENHPASDETWREAVRCWQALIRLDPGDRDAHHDLARAYRRFGLWADAEREYRDVLRIGQQPDDGDVWVYSVHGEVAEMLEKQGRLSQAIAEWRALAMTEYAGEEEIRRARERIAALEKALSHPR